MRPSTTETLVRILGLYYLAEGAIAIASRIVSYIEFLGSDNPDFYPKGYFWSYFFGAFPLLIGILILLYSKPLARWMHREGSEVSDA